jgi:hypothetical protein
MYRKGGKGGIVSVAMAETDDIKVRGGEGVLSWKHITKPHSLLSLCLPYVNYVYKTISSEAAIDADAHNARTVQRYWFDQTAKLLFRPDDDLYDWSKSIALYHLFCIFTVLHVGTV